MESSPIETANETESLTSIYRLIGSVDDVKKVAVYLQVPSGSSNRLKISSSKD